MSIEFINLLLNLQNLPSSPIFPAVKLAALVLVMLFLITLILMHGNRPESNDTVASIKVSYVGISAQIRRNKANTKRMFILYPLFALIISAIPALIAWDWIPGAVTLVIFALWYAVSYSDYANSICRATGSRPITRRENPRVYNLLENLCIACGMADIPNLHVIETGTLNAFASGMKPGDYTVTLTRGIINKLDDDELEGVIAHELTHIRNGDVKLMTLSLVFNGIYRALPSLVRRFARRNLLSVSMASGRAVRKSGLKNVKNAKNVLPAVIVSFLLIWVLLKIVHGVATLMHFSISRKREYMADAGAARLTEKPWALAGALKKISGDACVDSVVNEDLAGMFIANPCVSKGLSGKSKSGFNGLINKVFLLDDLTATHPDIRVRIKVLEQFE